MRYPAISTFWLKIGSLSPAVTLKIRSRSPEPNQLFTMSQCYIHANLVKIWQPVHEISCKQESVTPTPTGSAPKTICPPPLSVGGHNQSRLSRRGERRKSLRETTSPPPIRILSHTARAVFVSHIQPELGLNLNFQ